MSINMKQSEHCGRAGYLRLRGFTLVELLVTVAITGIMVLAISKVFTITSDAVSLGIGTSDILGNARTINAQIAEDAREMIGPANDGFLVILNKEYNVPVLPVDLETNQTFTVRSDQLVFIRNRVGLEPLCPSSDTSVGNTSSAMEVKIWYGHCKRTSPYGTDFFDDNGNGVQDSGEAIVGDLGQPDQVNGSDITDRPGTNELAVDWILGRQAMFLENGVTTVQIDADTSKGNDFPNWLIEYYDSNNRLEVKDSSGNYLYNRWYTALADIIDLDLVGATNSVINDITNPLLSNGYPGGAYNYTYGGQSGSDRLWVNPTPGYVYDPAQRYNYNSWQIAQMHPYFGGHVSDFIVEFAGDYAGNINGQPFGLPDGKIDTIDDNTTLATGNVTIMWYSMDNPPPNGVSGGFNDLNNTETPIWENSTTSGNPPPLADHAFVWRHDDVTSWPYLIRIRYRLHDPDGEIVGADGQPGRWFEQIIRVNRN